MATNTIPTTAKTAHNSSHSQRLARKRSAFRKAKPALQSVAGQWGAYFSKYTNGTYTEHDNIVHFIHSTRIIQKLYENEEVGTDGLRYLVAWGIYRQLAEFTEPYLFRGERSAEDSCYVHVKNVMNLAVINRYFLKGSLPDVPLNRTFPSWIKARSISTHYFWTDQSNLLYNEEDVNAYYMPGGGYILVPTAIMHRPFFYADVPRALNYGGLGMIIAHEFMHAFDVIHIRRHYWDTATFKKEYTKRALCLRRSHRSVLSLTSEEDKLNDVVDSENLADLVGATIAHKAFSSLPPNHKNVKLAGLNMSSEQLYFISHCATWCADNRIRAKRYAPYRSRCMVPLRNMPEFSRAFNCKIGTTMNPQQKCSFW
ncbi:hypothetical protein HPB50_009645 [Hyalomma asiaticum]|uniref:Uncharacterized protein n=1 Tax=Hyalomma asiaticum TaxID=266040 RepID=A0ACB7SCC2_HYAAI|nr:hypothetical protein HPB50_009645 [Hyalomma asiaticum]